MPPTQRKTGLSDAVQVQDGTGSDVLDTFETNIASASHDIEIPSELISSVGAAPGFVAHNDGQMSVSGDLTLRAIDLKPLQLLGSYSESDTDGDTTTEWQITSQDTLPEWEFHQQITENHTIILSGYDDSGAEPVPDTGFKFDSVTVSFEKDSPVTLEFNGVGLYAEVQQTTISTNYSTVNPANWLDAHVKIDGTAVGSLDSGEVSINRDSEAYRGLEDVDPNYRLLPTQVVEGMRDIGVSLSIEVTDTTAWENLFDDDTAPHRPSDERSEHTVEVVLGNPSDDVDTNDTNEGVLTLTGVQFENTGGELEDNADVRIQDIEGNARDWSVQGEE